MNYKIFFLFLVSCFCGVGLRAEAGLNLSALEDLAIQENGRSKPMYVFAQEGLRALYGKNSWKDTNSNKTYSAMEVVVDMAFHPQDWKERAVIRVDHLNLKKELGLTPRDKYFSYATLVKSEKLEELLNQVVAHQEKASGEKLAPILEAVKTLGAKLELFERLAGGRSWFLVPHPTEPNGTWLAFPDAKTYYKPEQLSPAFAAFQNVLQGYLDLNQTQFDSGCAQMKETLRALSPSVYPKESILALEHSYIQIHPFRLAWIAYLIALVTLVLTTLKFTTIGYRVAWFFAALGFLIQVGGFTARTIISGRAPVTNMYETVIWLGFGIMLFAMILEGIYRCRYFLLGATPIAVITLILADSLPAVLNSAIHPLVPVLRNNFWLTTHVLTITSSYAAMALALGVGHIIIFKVLFNKSVSAALYQYLYRAIQIGVLLLGVGTLLGAVWANYSWGRFWDWDPKETWALIAFLSYLVILHGRLAGWWGGFGLAIGSVLAFLSVVMAWYGVNFILGVGLHSYGFGAGGLQYVSIYAGLEITLVVVALVVNQRNKKINKTAAA